MNNSRRQRPQRTVSLRKQIAREFEGSVPKGRDDPPPIVVAPWYPAVLVSRGTTPASPNLTAITAQTLQTGLRSQLGLSSTTDLSLRVQRIDMWLDPLNTTAGTSTSNLALIPCSFVNPNFGTGNPTRATKYIEDVGTPVRHAHCHYIWPRSEQNIVILPTAANQNIFIYDTNTPLLGYTIHTHVLWRALGADPVPSFRL